MTSRAIRFAVSATICLLASLTGGAQNAVERTDAASIVHVLNRIGFGPRVGDVERVRRIGLDTYINQQLHPEKIADEAMAARLEALATLGLSTRELSETYFEPAREARRAQQAVAAGMPERMDQMRSPESMTPVTNERIVITDLQQQKVLRAVHSERQLEELMVDFWFNHFNVFAGKGQTRVYLTSYERDTIRPRVLGTFRDLLGAVAESPAMLFYLDNWQSSAPMASRQNRRPQLANRRPSGVNENYARELMELHTLGVDGGYTQRDVQEVARAFTGWTIANPRQGGGFEFNPRMHDDREKMVLGQRIPAGGGRADGERVLDILARHPSTARFIASKLARRFVSDDPPAALVSRAAARFIATGGNIREVVRLIVTSPEFSAPAAQRAKVKTPFEFVVSAIRATGTDISSALPIVQAVRGLGMPIYGSQPPTGYADRAEAWVNAGALLARMNFAMALTSGSLDGKRRRADRVQPPMSAGASNLHAMPDALVRDVLADQLTSSTRAMVEKATQPSQGVALLLGSPEFQKR
jgi:uncharacterized protein (DUF1800 family)